MLPATSCSRALPNHDCHSVAWKDFEQVVFAVLLGEEKPGLASKNPINRSE
jgi:hypothetical protein